MLVSSGETTPSTLSTPLPLTPTQKTPRVSEASEP